MSGAIVQIQVRRGTAAVWTSANPTLLAGEYGYETDTGKSKIGDGSTAWTGLGYINTGPAGPTGAAGQSTIPFLGDDPLNEEQWIVLPPAPITQPRCTSTYSTTQSLATSTNLACLFDVDVINIGPLHSTSVNTSRFTVPVGGGGFYNFNSSIVFGAPLATGRFLTVYRKNGSQLSPYVGVSAIAGSGNGVSASYSTPLVDGDYIEVIAFQDTGGTINIGNSFGLNTMSIFKL